jgi:PTS system galactitol-specific IIB component
LKNILVCCGTSMITSSVVVNKLKGALEKEGIQARFHQCKYSDVPHMVNTINADIVIPTGKLGSTAAKGVPVVNGTSFLTGIGLDDTIREIVDILKE